MFIRLGTGFQSVAVTVCVTSRRQYKKDIRKKFFNAVP